MTAIWWLRFVVTFVIASAVVEWWRSRRKHSTRADLKSAILQVLKPGVELRMVELWDEVYRATGKEPSLGALYTAVNELDGDGVTASVYAPFSIYTRKPRTQRFVRRIA